MQSQGRLIAVISLIIGIVAVVLGVTWLQRAGVSRGQPHSAGSPTPLPAGAVPIYLNGSLAAGFTPDGLDALPTAQFTDTVENRPQEGWLLSDILLRALPDAAFTDQTQVVVTSSSRKKSALLTWAQIQAPENYVMFDLSNRGTLKLVSVLSTLDTREEWVQDVDRIEVTAP